MSVPEMVITPEEFEQFRKRLRENLRLRGDEASIPACSLPVTLATLKQKWPIFRNVLRKVRRYARQKDCPPGVGLEEALAVIIEFEKMCGESLRWAKRVARSPAKATYDKTRDKTRTLARAAQDKARAPARKEARAPARQAYDKARAPAKAAYDRTRVNRPSGRGIDDRLRGGHFVAVDSEGFNIGEPFYRGKGKDQAKYQRHKSGLWSAGGAAGFEDQSLVDRTGKGLSSEQILEFLTSLPRKFTHKDSTALAPIFISFSFGYDLAQIVADMPYEKAWELLHGKPWSRRDDPKCEARFTRWVYWRDYALSYIPRKSITIARLKDPDNPARRVKLKENDHVSLQTLTTDRIQIYDVFGFSQCSFLNTLEDMPEGTVVTREELEIIKEGKASRAGFKFANIEKIKRYNGLELKALVNVTEMLRTSLREAIPGRPIRLKNWWGPGAIADAVLTSYLGKDARNVLGDIANDSEPLRWVRCAFFGARIEPPMAGRTKNKLWEYDITSAYPAHQVELPSMKGGQWVYKENPTREDIEQSCALSMFEIHTSGCNPNLSFYPLPWRCRDGAILFPRSVDGNYMRDHAIGAFKWFDEFTRRGTIGNYGLEPDGPRLVIPGGWFFIPANPDEKPFAFIKDLFIRRVEYLSRFEKDVRGKALKLGINSLYGKLAQSVGRKGRPPKFAAPWHAAAITAGTQRMALEAALRDPGAIIRFATDAIQATRPLDLNIPGGKLLGHWTREVAKHGGSFIQPGVYSLHLDDPSAGDKSFKIATRGYSPQNVVGDANAYRKAVDEDLFEKIPAAWAEGKPTYSFEYKQYMSLGVALASRDAWRLIGCWKTASRALQLDDIGRKRTAPGTERLRKMRASKLVPLPVVHRDFWLEEGVMSYPYTHDWLSDEVRMRHETEREHEYCVAGFF